MTQFILVALRQISAAVPGVALVPATSNSFLAEAGRNLFPGEAQVWSVERRSSEAGDLMYEAQLALRDGGTMRETTLGRVLLLAAGQAAGIAFFYGSDYLELPIAESPNDLFELVREQLLVDSTSNLEVYGRWSGGA